MKEDHSKILGKLTLVDGGLIHKIISFLHKKNDALIGSPRAAIGLMVITWVPLLVLAIFSGTSNDTDQSISFFEDFFVHVRFLLVLPFLILIEKTVDSTFIEYIQTTYKLVTKEEKEKYIQLIDRIHKLVESFIPEILFLVMVYVLTLQNWAELSVFDSNRNYLTVGNHTPSFAGWYYLLVCSPLLQLILFRWLWRWMIWSYSIFRFSRLRILADPLHADQMAGLQYLNITPLSFSMILIAPSSILSSYIGIDIIYSNAAITDYYFQILAYVIVFPIIIYTPLFFFTGILLNAKKYGIQYFGNLLRVHNNDYVEKWITGNPPKDEQLLGSMDNSSLSDINGSYSPIQSMKPFPIDFKLILPSILLNVLPYIPLIFTYYSAAELFRKLIQNVLGS